MRTFSLTTGVLLATIWSSGFIGAQTPAVVEDEELSGTGLIGGDRLGFSVSISGT